MHYITCLLILIYSLTFILITTPSAHASITVIDALSRHKRFNRLLIALQRTRLIPYLNSLPNCTLIAPVNEAFDKLKLDSDHKVTNATLLYHILKEEHNIDEFYDGQILETHYVNEGYLGEGPDNGQRVNITKLTKDGKNKLLIGGFPIIEAKGDDDIDLGADNGRIYMTADVLFPPKDIATILSGMPELQNLFKILKHADIIDSLKSQHPYTLFASEQDPLHLFNNEEKAYLFSEPGIVDLQAFLQHHIHDGLFFSSSVDHCDILFSFDTYSNAHDDEIHRCNVSTIAGQHIELSKDGNKIFAGDANVTKKDIIASNGAIHVISQSQSLPSLLFTPRKYLIGMNATKYVDQLDKAGLSAYIDNTNESNPYTFLAPHNDAFDTIESTLAVLNEEEMEKLWRYHIVEGSWSEKRLINAGEVLLKTELAGKELNGNKQRLKASALDSDFEGPNFSMTDKPKKKSIMFGNAGGNAGVVDTPAEIARSVIYIITQPLVLPPGILDYIKPEPELSEFIVALSGSDVEDTFTKSPGVTILIPNNGAFNYIGLMARYLLLPEANSDLQIFLKYHVLKDLAYIPELQEGSNVFTTITDEKVVMNKTAKDVYIWGVDSDSDAHRPAPGSNRETIARIEEQDILVSNGVMHILDRVEIPPTLEITIRKLLRGARATTFLEVLHMANLTDLVLSPDTSFTILVPTNDAFARVNLTQLYNDPVALLRVVRLHIVPGKLEWTQWRDDYELPTLLSQSDSGNVADKESVIIVRETTENDFTLHVKGSKPNDRARVLSIGKTHFNGGTSGGGVVLIDHVLDPRHSTMPWWATLLIGIGCITGLGIIGFVTWTLWKRRHYNALVDTEEGN